MFLTVATIESLATKVTISAQETMPGHSFSSRLFAPSIKPNPLIVRFGIANFSVWLPELEVKFSKIDASQPW